MCFTMDTSCVKQSKKSQVPKVVITYWKNDECEEEGDNVTLTLYGRLADYMMPGRPKFRCNVNFTLLTLKGVYILYFMQLWHQGTAWRSQAVTVFLYRGPLTLRTLLVTSDAMFEML